ncbi:MAG: rRNA maturation RNase YbeY [Firmicutes bacterium]|jgi:probable rRNA maturation factor|nr:rRNA maturation RNase YbeY [Bacillota bacterium]HOB21719.1 rRNA maturation RNase YbeY [Bacillota bacterium]HQD39017.1 rRNA maturation RNase YbeY [Bacillota bacterium]
MGEVAVLCGEELNEEEVEGYLAFLKQVTAVALRRLIEREDWELTVSLVGEEQMRQLNRTWRNIDAPTDVLSFPMLEEGFDDNLLGDVVICLPVAEKQAKEYGHGLSRELAFLAVHGILHLLGRDHENDIEREMMEREQEALLDSMGLRR